MCRNRPIGQILTFTKKSAATVRRSLGCFVMPEILFLSLPQAYLSLFEKSFYSTRVPCLRPFPVISYETKNLCGPVGMQANPFPVWPLKHLLHKKTVLPKPAGEDTTKKKASIP